MFFFVVVVKALAVWVLQKKKTKKKKTIAFSAPCPHWVYTAAKKYMKHTYGQEGLVGKKTQKTAVTVEHLAIRCHWTQRATVIGDVRRACSGFQGRTIIFCEMKKEAQELSQNVVVRQDAQSLHRDIP